jgi:tRNA nucleotidyltransferase (CCA-adding enzyme)
MRLLIVLVYFLSVYLLFPYTSRHVSDWVGPERNSMPLTNTELKYYDSNVLRLPQEKRTEYHRQVDRLVATLGSKLKEQTDIKVTKVVKAGSFAKYTILRKTSDDPVDVDVVFYISGKDADHESLASLTQAIYDVLIKLYPNKSVEHFEIQRKAATVNFIGSGLSVDIVPVIENTSKPGYGWQYDIRDGSRVETCAPCQVKFVQNRKDVDANFRTLVRLGKRWRRQAQVELKSFMVELVMAHLLDKNGSSGSIEQRFRDFLLYIAQSGLKEVIRFPENGLFVPTFTDPVVIIDPVNSSNNVASRMTEAERLEIVEAAQSSWEAAYFASQNAGEEEVWKEVFGPRFQVEQAA